VPVEDDIFQVLNFTLPAEGLTISLSQFQLDPLPGPFGWDTSLFATEGKLRVGPLEPVDIVSQPVELISEDEDTVVQFSVAAVGGGLSYQWQFSTTNDPMS